MTVGGVDFPPMRKWTPSDRRRADLNASFISAFNKLCKAYRYIRADPKTPSKMKLTFTELRKAAMGCESLKMSKVPGGPSGWDLAAAVAEEFRKGTS